MPGAAATIGSNHVCPMCTGTVPHVGGPIIGPGVPTVLIGGKPAAVMGDMCVCVGPPDTIVMGVANVLIGGKSAVTVGDMTAHGGSIVMGEPTVLIGTSQAVPTAVMPIQNIPFPEITSRDRRAARRAGQDLTEAENNQNAIREAATNSEQQQGEPRIFNLRWEDKEVIVRKSRIIRVIAIKGQTVNIKDGESVNIKIKTPDKPIDKEKEIVVNGKVRSNVVIATWEVENTENQK